MMSPHRGAVLSAFDTRRGTVGIGVGDCKGFVPHVCEVRRHHWRVTDLKQQGLERPKRVANEYVVCPWGLKCRTSQREVARAAVAGS